MQKWNKFTVTCDLDSVNVLVQFDLDITKYSQAEILARRNAIIAIAYAETHDYKNENEIIRWFRDAQVDFVGTESF